MGDSPAARAVEAVEPAALDDRLVDGRACSAGAGSAEQGSREGPGAARRGGRRETIFALLGYPLTSTVGVIAVVRARWSWRAMYRLRQRRISLGFLPSAVRRAT